MRVPGLQRTVLGWRTFLGRAEAGSADRVKGHAESLGEGGGGRLYGQEEGSKRGGSDFVSGDRHDTAACVSADMKTSGDENAPERSEQRASLQAGRGWENSSSLGTVWFKRHFGYPWATGVVGSVHGSCQQVPQAVPGGQGGGARMLMEVASQVAGARWRLESPEAIPLSPKTFLVLAPERGGPGAWCPQGLHGVSGGLRKGG